MYEDTELYLQELFGDDFIEHYGRSKTDGAPVGSGRYPLGSGERLHQHEWDVYTRFYKLKKLNPGVSEQQIAAWMGYYQKDKRGNYILNENGEKIGNTSELRREKQIATNTVKKDKIAELNWYDTHTDPDTGKPYTDTKITKLMGAKNESSIRSLRKTAQNGKQNKTAEVADRLKEVSQEKGFIDVGKGTELNLGISQDGLKTSIAMLEREGYTIKNFRVAQVGATNGQQTEFKVLCPPGSDDVNLKQHLDLIKTVDDPDGIQSKATKDGLGDPPRVDLSRIQIRYDEDGGTQKDGMIEIRAKRDENGNLVSASPDLSLGNARYAQVRIAVQGDRYIKGMAVYNEDLPEGTDILVNSNKSRSKGVDGALKEMHKSKDGSILTVNPFGAAVVQTEYKDPQTGETKRSAINIVGSGPSDMHKEGAWGDWSKNLPSQFLAKQSLALVKEQLKLESQGKENELDQIRSLNNPVVKKKMLLDFAEECDAAAVDLKAAPFGGQRTHVLLAGTTIKPTEVYAPNYENGTTLALVRFPHQGPFEIPILKVNNNNKEAKAAIGQALDAVMISHDTAGKLSGADFDGDTVIAIPMTKRNSQGEFEKKIDIHSAPSLELDLYGGKHIKLSDFDPTGEYGLDNPRFADQKAVGKDGKIHPTYPYFKTDRDKGREMGVVSNLMTDMYAKGCSSSDELARADAYSMVVIDAKKHELNYKQAYKDFGIQELKDKYQSNPDGSHGASSLLSRAKSPFKVPSRSLDYSIDPETGKKIYKDPKYGAYKSDGYWERVPAPKGYVWKDSKGKEHRGAKYMKDPETGKDIIATRDGKIVQGKDGTYSYDRGSGKDVWVETGKKRREQEVPRMSVVDDARELLSDPKRASEIEQTYALYANHMKALGNEARKESLAVPHQKYDPSARQQYQKEVDELNTALVKAKKNAPKERQAQLLATSIVNGELADHPEYESDEKKKLRGQALNIARDRTGASKDRVKFTEKQWEAINAGAISESKLTSLLANADKDSYIDLALPKNREITSQQEAYVRSLIRAGFSRAEAAKQAGISESSVYNIAKEM